MSDYNFLMESRLSPGQVQVLSQVSRAAGEQGLNLYLVGGAVRDLTYGQQMVRDLDFAVEGNPRRILRHLASGRPARPRRGETWTAPNEPAPLEVDYLRFNSRMQAAEFGFTNGVQAEMAMCRNEVYAKPGRPPAISPATIFDDLKRRDFTVNAMAVSLHPNSRGLLLDPTNGGADIEKRELRVMHSRSFAEDPARIYRLVRLGMRLDFKPEERTKQYLESALASRLWERIDPAQQGRELRAILQEENPRRVLKMFSERGMLAALDRKVARARLPYERLAKIRSVVRAVPGSDPFLLNFHCLVEKFGPGQRSRLARKIIGQKRAIKLVLSFDREARKLARALASSQAALPSRVYTLLSKQPQPLPLFLLVHYPQARIQHRIKKYLFKYLQVRARSPRAELQGLGVKPGRKFEKMIDRVFFDQLDGKIKTHQQLMKQLRALAGIKEPPPKPPKPAKRAQPAAGRIMRPAKPAGPLKPTTPRKSAAPAIPAKPAPAAKRLKKQRKK